MRRLVVGSALSLAHSKQRWRKGGYNMIDAHTAGLRSMSTAYMSYLGDEKRRRDGQRDAAVQLGVALNRCPRCQSEAHVVSRTRWVREP